MGFYKTRGTPALCVFLQKEKTNQRPKLETVLEKPWEGTAEVRGQPGEECDQKGPVLWCIFWLFLKNGEVGQGGFVPHGPQKKAGSKR